MASTNLFEITPSTTWEATQTAPSAREEEEETQVYEVTEAGEDDDEVLVAMNMLHNQLVLNMEKRKEKRVRFAGVEMPERQRKSVPEPSTAPSITKSEKESLSKFPGASNHADELSLTTYPTPATKANPVVTVVNPTTTIAKKPADGPQFKYQSPIEDPSIPSSVLNRALDTSILLSHRELLAIAPDLRKQVRELISPKRIAVYTFTGAETNAEAYIRERYNRVNLQGGQVSIDSAHLRQIKATVEDHTKCECVLDQGCTIVAMRKDVWARSGLALRQDQVLVMESANESRDRTMGKLPMVRFGIGGYSFLLQVHIVDKSPCEVLLG